MCFQFVGDVMFASNRPSLGDASAAYTQNESPGAAAIRSRSLMSAIASLKLLAECAEQDLQGGPKNGATYS